MYANKTTRFLKPIFILFLAGISWKGLGQQKQEQGILIDPLLPETSVRRAAPKRYLANRMQIGEGTLTTEPR